MSLIILVLIIISYSQNCNQTINIDFLAISNDVGSLVPTNIRFDGIGDKIFLRLLKVAGTDTQKSFVDAYYLSSPGCNVYVDINSDVEGGSGGLLFYIILKYRTNNTGATGGIDENGNILPIGGLYEKIQVGSNRFKNFVVPVGSRYQYYTTKILPYDITYASRIEDLRYDPVNRIVYGKNTTDTVFTYPQIPSTRSSYNTTILIPIYTYLRDFYTSIGEIGIHELDKYYSELIGYVDRIAELGYYYTASNIIFLAASERNALYYLHNQRDPNLLRQMAESCLNRLNIRGNSENDIAALTRYEWAKQVLNREYTDLHEDRYRRYQDYTQAYLWCKLADSIYENKQINYSDEHIKKTALAWLVEGFKQIDEQNSDRYMVALSKIITDPLISSYNLAFLVRKDGFLRSNYRSIWANIYASQAEYLRGIGADGTELAYVANNLETIFGDPSLFDMILDIFDKPKISNSDLLKIKNVAFIASILILLYFAGKITESIMKILILILLIAIVVMFI
ncbi:MAG: hypothetical protein NZ908_01835 [Candidatus Micrarchaeota archaeon]|nr:hypothetical protein [Candidatus Micrarchaeota archaeon]MCX8154732.1 hypothetical protein [Candidatus Micrarchaeota archaeon]